nr:unnamed protein product [Spirometra erinaceieuropaei]
MSIFQCSSQINFDITDDLLRQSSNSEQFSDSESEWNYEADEDAIIIEDVASSVALTRLEKNSELVNKTTLLKTNIFLEEPIENQVENFLARIRDCQLVETEALRKIDREVKSIAGLMGFNENKKKQH